MMKGCRDEDRSKILDLRRVYVKNEYLFKVASSNISFRLLRIAGAEFDSRSRRTCGSTALRFGSYVELFFTKKFRANENKLFSIVIFLPATLA